jgi:2-oxoisovalerate dehydrogenase E2 component (dihydrolipoyl transacylase)
MPSPEVRRFLLPDLGEGLEDAEVVAWRVAEGDTVELNQTLVEVNTAKALVEIPAPWAGVVEKLHAGEGDVVRVGAPLVSIRVAQAPDAAASATEHGEAKPGRQPILVGYGVEEERATARPGRERRAGGSGAARGRQGPTPASPPVRRLARELGVELAAVAGSGPGGRVTRQDVMAAVSPATDLAALRNAQREPLPGGLIPVTVSMGEVEGEAIPVRGIRRMIAEKMTRSVTEIPHVTTFLTLDATWLLAFRNELRTESGERLSPLPIVVRALAEVCGAHPKLNASFNADQSEIMLFRQCHVGIATDTDRGLLVTVVRDAGRRGILDISREIARLAEAARAGTVKPEEVAGSTITVTNVGTFGSEFGTPIINYPEAAILALGVIEPRALVVEGRLEARPAVTLSLSFDHRVMDGAEAGRALKALGGLLQSPFKLGALPG